MSPTDRRYHFAEDVRDMPASQYRAARAAMLASAARDIALQRPALPAAFVQEPVEASQPGVETGTTASVAKPPTAPAGGARSALDMSPAEHAAAVAELIRRSR